MSDPYFQQLFADRIGGANYGKGTEIYKFEKIKRAKTEGAGRLSRSLAARLRHRRERRHGAGVPVRERMAEEINQPENRGYADNGIAEFKEAAARFMKRNFGVESRSGDGSQSLHRLEDGAGHAAGGIHQPGRHHADDRARLSGRRHAYGLLRRLGLQAAAAGRERLPARSDSRFPPTSRPRPSCWC